MTRPTSHSSLDTSRVGGREIVYPTNPQYVEPGILVKMVRPTYPRLALDYRMQGPVILSVHITEEGKVTVLKAVSGPLVLVPAAVAAVSQWTYSPASFNGAPVSTSTLIRLNFRLQ